MALGEQFLYVMPISPHTEDKVWLEDESSIELSIDGESEIQLQLLFPRCTRYAQASSYTLLTPHPSISGQVRLCA